MTYLYGASRPDAVRDNLKRNKDGIAKLTNFVAYVAQHSDEEINLIAALQ